MVNQAVVNQELQIRKEQLSRINHIGWWAVKKEKSPLSIRHKLHNFKSRFVIERQEQCCA